MSHSQPTTAIARLAQLIGEAEVIDGPSHYNLDGATILVATLVGDPDSDGEDYYSDDVAVAWDSALDRSGERGACYVAQRDLATWLSLRWPCTISGPGFARDGFWYSDGFEALRR